LKSLTQINAINAATEAACLILSVDETVKNPKVMLMLLCVG
jgi:T-complex protein 1 subunit eta